MGGSIEPPWHATMSAMNDHDDIRYERYDYPESELRRVLSQLLRVDATEHTIT
jgi:hypothetical protein